MPRANPQTRIEILDAAQRLMLAKGFAAVSVEEICKAAGLTKGGLFHYFKSKEELGRAVLERFCRNGAKAQQEAPFVAKADPLERFCGLIDFIIQAVRDPVKNGCLVGVFSQELPHTGPAIQALCARAFAQWAAGLKATLDEAKKKYAPRAKIDTQSLAEHFIAVYEGALVLAKARNDVAPVKQCLLHCQQYVQILFGKKPG